MWTKEKKKSVCKWIRQRVEEEVKKEKEPGWANETVDDNMSYVHSLRLKFLGQTL